MIHFQILTLFPQLFPGPLAESITGIALGNKLWSLEVFNIRDYSENKHQKVDDIPYGGGAGMVLRADVLGNAIENIAREKSKIIYLSPRGKKFDQKTARKLAKEKEITFICGRYEGVDQRVLDAYEIEELSIGDYVLSGGEIAAYVVVDAVLRNVSGVLGADESLDEESFGCSDGSEYENLLEYPQYTRPDEWRGRAVPDVLKSGHHANIKKWRKDRAVELTKKNRPDLLD